MNKSQIQFDPEWYASTLILEYNNTTVKKHSKIKKLPRFTARHIILQKRDGCSESLHRI